MAANFRYTTGVFYLEISHTSYCRPRRNSLKKIAQLFTDFIAFKSSLSNVTEKSRGLGNPSVDLMGNR